VQPDGGVEVVEHVRFGPLELCRCHDSQSLQFRVHLVDPTEPPWAHTRVVSLKFVGLPGRHNQVSFQCKPLKGDVAQVPTAFPDLRRPSDSPGVDLASAFSSRCDLGGDLLAAAPTSSPKRCRVRAEPEI
jgi:hypothetical protein